MALTWSKNTLVEASKLNNPTLSIINFETGISIGSPTEGLMVWDDYYHCPKYYNGTEWVYLRSGKNRVLR